MRIVSGPPVESGPSRIAALAMLPVFLDLGGKRALVFGCSAAAAWKAELLASAGAEVSVFAPEDECAGEMRSLFDRSASAGSLRHHDAPWRQADLAGAALMVADARSPDEAGAVRAAARAAGVPLNVIDRPDFCDFQFGAIAARQSWSASRPPGQPQFSARRSAAASRRCYRRGWRAGRKWRGMRAKR